MIIFSPDFLNILSNEFLIKATFYSSPCLSVTKILHYFFPKKHLEKYFFNRISFNICVTHLPLRVYNTHSNSFIFLFILRNKFVLLHMLSEREVLSGNKGHQLSFFAFTQGNNVTTRNKQKYET